VQTTRVSDQVCTPASSTTKNTDEIAEFFKDLLARPPIYQPGTTPVQSNTAFQLLAYALEDITGKSYSDMLANLTETLGMSDTSLAAPDNTSIAVVPSDPTTSRWSADYGDKVG
jgi:CubicO group peptidase (beta-lactamase class C family)